MSKNVFKFGYLSWKRVRNWPGNIANFFRTFKWAWQRATKGFAWCDVWNLDAAILDYMHGTLSHLADNHWGFPGDDRFPTDESWTEFLHAAAQKFYQANENNEYYPTPAESAWWEYLNTDNKNKEKLEGLANQMYEECAENEKKRQQDFSEAWSMIGDVFWNLWD